MAVPSVRQLRGLGPCITMVTSFFEYYTGHVTILSFSKINGFCLVLQRTMVTGLCVYYGRYVTDGTGPYCACVRVRVGAGEDDPPAVQCSIHTRKQIRNCKPGALLSYMHQAATEPRGHTTHCRSALRRTIITTPLGAPRNLALACDI